MFPELHTERFSLKRITAADQPFIFKGLSDPAVISYYGVSYKTLEETSSQMDFYDGLWREKTGIWWKIVDRQSGEPVGACGMNYYNPTHQKAEIGYWLLPGFWKKGIMPEVIPVVINHLFKTWKLHRLEALIEDSNESSWRLAEKLGFKYEGRLRESEIKNGRRIDLLMYSLLSSDKRV
jgi:ribosomal-protein-alanine N-acetyltransferase